MYSAIPPQYVENTSVQPDASDDVVIVVPSDMDNDQLEEVIVGSDLPDNGLCSIEAEHDLDPSSPKTITESSSKFNYFPLRIFF